MSTSVSDGENSALSSLTKYAPAFQMGTGAIGLAGSVFGIVNGIMSSAATAAFRTELLSKLDEIANELEKISGELQGILAILKKIDQRLAALQQAQIENFLTQIETTYQSISAIDLDPHKELTPAQLAAFRKIADEMFEPDKGVLFSMNSIHNLLLDKVFTDATTLSEITLSAYFYIRFRLNQGLHLLSLGCAYATLPRDYGQFLKNWAQNFYAQTKTVIAIGEAKPLGTPDTIRWPNIWRLGYFSDGLPYFDWNFSVYCTDAVAIGAHITPEGPDLTLAYDWKGDMQGFYSFSARVVYADKKDDTFDKNPRDMYCLASAGVPSSSSVGFYFKYKDGVLTQLPLARVKESTFECDDGSKPDQGDKPIFNECLSWYFSQETHFDFPSTLFYLTPQSRFHAVSGKLGNVYLGSVDGQVVELNGEKRTITAVIFDGEDQKNVLVYNETDDSISTAPFSSLDTFKYCLWQLEIIESETSSFTVKAVNKKDDYYLVIKDDKAWGLTKGKTVLDPTLISVLRPKVLQKLDNPFHLRPVAVNIGSALGADDAKTVIIHPSPFDKS